MNMNIASSKFVFFFFLHYLKNQTLLIAFAGEFRNKNQSMQISTLFDNNYMIMSCTSFTLYTAATRLFIIPSLDKVPQTIYI